MSESGSLLLWATGVFTGFMLAVLVGLLIVGIRAYLETRRWK